MAASDSTRILNDFISRFQQIYPQALVKLQQQTHPRYRFLPDGAEARSLQLLRVPYLGRYSRSINFGFILEGYIVFDLTQSSVPKAQTGLRLGLPAILAYLDDVANQMLAELIPAVSLSFMVEPRIAVNTGKSIVGFIRRRGFLLTRSKVSVNETEDWKGDELFGGRITPIDVQLIVGQMGAATKDAAKDDTYFRDKALAQYKTQHGVPISRPVY